MRFYGWIVAMCLYVAGAPAQAAEKQVMNYDVYAGGFHVVKSELVVDTSKKNQYNLSLDAKTYGFLNKLVGWNGVFETKGWSGKNGALRPEEHRSQATSKGKYENKVYQYGKDGSFISYQVKDNYEDNLDKRDPDPALTKDTTDVLTATLEVMQSISAKGKCEGSDEIFDGVRRYRLIFHHKQEVGLKANNYNAYEGPATECTVEVVPLLGKWHERPRGWMSIQEQGRKAGTMPTMWFAQVSKGEPAVPVKIRVKTDYGTLFMHLIGYNNGKQTLKLASK